MRCGCIERIAGMLGDTKQKELAVPISSVTCDLVGYMLGGGVSLLIPFTVRAPCRGYSGAHGRPASIRASFCPFCGDPLDAEIDS